MLSPHVAGGLSLPLSRRVRAGIRARGPGPSPSSGPDSPAISSAPGQASASIERASSKRLRVSPALPRAARPARAQSGRLPSLAARAAVRTPQDPGPASLRSPIVPAPLPRRRQCQRSPRPRPAVRYAASPRRSSGGYSTQLWAVRPASAAAALRGAEVCGWPRTRAPEDFEHLRIGFESLRRRSSSPPRGDAVPHRAGIEAEPRAAPPRASLT